MSRQKHEKRFNRSDSENREIEAILSEGLEALKQEPVKATDLSVIRSKLETLSSRKERNIMNNIQHKIKAHPRFSLVFVSAVMVLIFVVLVPFSYQKTVGYQVEYAIGNSQPAPTSEAINTALDAIGYGQARATISYMANTGKCRISILPNMKAVRETEALFSSIMGTFSPPNVSPIIETISGSLYAQVRDKLIKVEVDATGKTDQQIRDEIQAKLAAQGFKGNVIYVKSDRDSLGQDSLRQIKFELKVTADSCVSGSGPEMIQIDSRGKTPEQIKAEIQARLAEKGMPNAEVEVSGNSTDSTNKQQIKIEIKDCTDK